MQKKAAESQFKFTGSYKKEYLIYEFFASLFDLRMSISLRYLPHKRVLCFVIRLMNEYFASLFGSWTSISLRYLTYERVFRFVI